MPRNYNQAPTGGTTTTGKAYEPMVTPNHRDDDDTSVIGGRNAGLDRKVSGQFGDDSEHAAKHATTAAAAPRTAAESALDDATRYDEDGKKTDKKKH